MYRTEKSMNGGAYGRYRLLVQEPGGRPWGCFLDANGHRVTLWSALKDEVEALSVSRVHPNLPGIKLPKSMGITGDLEEAMREKELLVMAVPSVFVRRTAARMRPWCQKRADRCQCG